ncbi:hypothetical protein Dsin_027675 [Dipteronia sinensis]|uniref:Reverse transcriptase zinc-binding domain-containing protein n=1 Tax=Dipteronia sinensis TaxID=43782 RepID=A0AAD9ZPM2_9ROSI|nr:hypothetical protein Dsin_027675 [Dipteronia sinensis]
MRFLSKSGRLVLIKAVLSNIPTYYMSVFKMPIEVTQKIERLQWEFFWGDGIEKRKIHTADWDTVCMSKSKGGLGIGRIVDKNAGLLAKWIWLFGCEEHSLWKKILCAKYGMNCSGVRWQWINSKQDSAFVKSIHRLFEGGSSTAFCLNEGLQIVIGRGDRANFWEDIRWDSIPLRAVFPRIFALSSKKVGKVCEFEKWQNVNWEWDVPLRRPSFDLEYEQWKCLLAVLDSVKLRNGIHDTIAWSLSPNEAFSVSSFLKCVEGTPLVNQCNSTLIWNGFHLPKVEVFVWNLMKGKTLVKDVMRRFGMDVSLNLSCTFCNSYPETLTTDEDSNTAEILAIHRVSAICASRPDFVGKEIIIASDSKSAVAWVNNVDGIGSFKHVDFIYDIRNYLRILGNSLVVYNPRYLNSFENNLAKMGSNNEGDKLEWSLS